MIYVSDLDYDVRASDFCLNPPLGWIQPSEFASVRVLLRNWFINSRSGPIL